MKQEEILKTKDDSEVFFNALLGKARKANEALRKTTQEYLESSGKSIDEINPYLIAVLKSN